MADHAEGWALKKEIEQEETEETERGIIGFEI
jgi:hypothetical protein